MAESSVESLKIVRRVVMHVSKVWMFRKSDENSIGIWKRKILRKIFVSVKENDGWRIKNLRTCGKNVRRKDCEEGA